MAKIKLVIENQYIRIYIEPKFGWI